MHVRVRGGGEAGEGGGGDYLRNHRGGWPEAQHLLHYLARIHHLIQNLASNGCFAVRSQPLLLLTHLCG